MRVHWDQYFMALAKLAAMRSGCNSRPTEAVIVKGNRVIATGYNGTIAGMPQCTDCGSSYCRRREVKQDDKGTGKYLECLSIHGEQNAINQVAQCGGINLHWASIYCTLFPCIFCLKNIVSVGIKKIFYELEYKSDDPERDTYWAGLAKEYGVILKQVTLSLKNVKAICANMSNFTSMRRL